MAAQRFSLYLDDQFTGVLRRRAAEENKTLSRYLSDLIRADEKRRLDALAEEGYRALAEESLAWAELSAKTDGEGSPPWDEGGSEES